MATDVFAEFLLKGRVPMRKDQAISLLMQAIDGGPGLIAREMWLGRLSSLRSHESAGRPEMSAECKNEHVLGKLSQFERLKSRSPRTSRMTDKEYIDLTVDAWLQSRGLGRIFHEQEVGSLVAEPVVIGI